MSQPWWPRSGSTGARSRSNAIWRSSRVRRTSRRRSRTATASRSCILSEAADVDGSQSQQSQSQDFQGQESPAHEDAWTVAGRTFRSRLIVGTGKYKDYAQNAAAAEAAGAEIVTVALRRVNLS